MGGEGTEAARRGGKWSFSSVDKPSSRLRERNVLKKERGGHSNEEA